MAKGDFAEATVGCTDLDIGRKWVQVFNTPDFKVDPVMDVAGAELCNAARYKSGRLEGLIAHCCPGRLGQLARLPAAVRTPKENAAPLTAQ